MRVGVGVGVGVGVERTGLMVVKPRYSISSSW